MPKKKIKKDEVMIDIGDENEKPIDIEIKDENDEIIIENPNIADQLDTAAADEDIDKKNENKDKTESDDEEELDKRTSEEKLEAYLDADDDAKAYSKDVQKRIKKLTYDWREAERREKAAIEYAQGVQVENTNLKTRQEDQDGVFINEHKTRLEAQLDSAKQQYKEAYDAENPELIADANQNIARFAAELTQAEQTEIRFKRHIAAKPAVTAPVLPYQPPVASSPATSSTTQPDPKAEEWATRNKWFGTDDAMTGAVMAIHQQLLTQDGYLPTTDAYYDELDSRMRKNFPDKFKKPKMQADTTVAPALNTLSGAKQTGKRTVRLTASQVAIAKKLGVPLAEYAKYV